MQIMAWNFTCIILYNMISKVKLFGFVYMLMWVANNSYRYYMIGILTILVCRLLDYSKLG